LCILALAVSLGTIHAQVLSGSMTVTAVDASDAVVPNASITVTNMASGRAFKGTTDAQGSFQFTNLENGEYRVVVEHAGFAKSEVDNVTVFTSQTTPLRVKMEVARTGTEVVVEAQATQVQTESVELKNVVTRQALDEMPLPTRNPMDLVKSFAGIMTPNTTAVTGGDAFVHGLRGSTTNLTQDGINVQDDFVKTSAFFALSSPVVDTIDEFNVTVGGGGADAGFGSAQVSMVTRRGTNDLHGSAYWFQRTSFLNANTWFNDATGVKTPFQLQNHLGATIGGPWYIPKIYNGKNKTFFFFAYEAYREPRSQPRIRTVMTTSAEQGLFTYTPTTGGAPLTVNLLNLGTIGTTGVKPTINATTMGIYQKIVPQSGYTNAGCGGGDIVNISCISLNLAGVNNQDRYTIRVDHQITSKHNFEFVWDRANFNTAPDFLNSNEPQFPGSPFTGGQISAREMFVWALTSVLTPSQTNEVRIGYQHSPVAFAYGNTFGETNGVQINYAGITSPIETTTNLPQGRNTPVRQFIDNYAWVKGNHQIRFGGEFRQVVADSYLWNTVFPRVTLGTGAASNPAGLSTANLPGISAAELTIANNIFANITGLYQSISEGFNHTSATSGYVAGVPENYTPIQNNLAFYVQDNWKVKRNLTAFYGVRWEFQGAYNARNGLVLLPQNGLSTLFGPTPITGSPVGNLFQPGLQGGDMNPLLTLQGPNNNAGSTVQNHYANFGPFAGITYAPGSDSKTVIRASFAQHYVQDGFTFWTPMTTSNTGLFTTATNSAPTGVFSSSGINGQLPTPIGGGFPVSQIANWVNFGGASPETDYAKNLKTPYVLEWSFGVQRDIGQHFILEARYVGNHAVHQYRGWNINQLDLNNNGVLQTFLAAQNNLAINTANGKSGFAYNGLPGQTPTPLLDTLFSGVAASAGYSSSTFVTNLQQNNIYSMFNTIRTSPTYRTNVMGANGTGASNGLPLNFFVADPWATNAILVNNAAWSMFDGLELEVRRRFSNLTVQGNYTFSKVLADNTIASSQSEQAFYQDLRNPGLDKFIASINVKHSIGATFRYDLPFGRGQKLLGSANRLENTIVGGWALNGFTHLSSGAPLSLTSNRFTTGWGASNPPVIVNMTAKQLNSNIGVYERGTGVYFINPNTNLFTIKGSTSTPNMCATNAAGQVTQTTPCFLEPAPGSLTNCSGVASGTPCAALSFNDLNLPWFFDQDLSITKMTTIFERVKFEIRLEAFNVFNHPTFTLASLSTPGATASSTSPNSLDSTSFGQLTGTFDTARGGGVTARVIQWGARFVF
jgi:hypothetical protein